ncbi:hypothetical protein ACWDAF_40870, partial [Streptomyces sp. NPDC001226]
MVSRQLSQVLDPPTTVLLTVECQQGVVGPDSALPELARQARSSGALVNVARLVAAAHEGGVQVIHAVAERRPDGRGANHNARLFHAAERLPVQQLSGSTAVRVAAPIEGGSPVTWRPARPASPADPVLRRAPVL